MKVFCYFVEPAAYTLDLAINVYDKNKIDYCFIKELTLVKSERKTDKIFLDRLSFFSKLKFLNMIFKSNDLIIVNGYNNYPFVITFILNLFSFKKKYIATDSDTQLSLPRNLLKRFVKWIYLNIIFRSKYVLGFAGGSNTHKELFRYYGMHECRIFLMPMVVDNLKFYQKTKNFPDTFSFLYVGRLVKHKNVEGLIKQFNKNFADKDSVVLKIIGEGCEEEYLKRKYCSDKILFLGELFNVKLIQEFQNASCFVFPSHFEPWGLVVNEALSSGLPVIANKNVGSVYDLISEKNTGIIALDMDDFGSKMLLVYSNSHLLESFSKNAFDIMANNWNYDLYNQCLVGVIKKIRGWD